MRICKTTQTNSQWWGLFNKADFVSELLTAPCRQRSPTGLAFADTQLSSSTHVLTRANLVQSHSKEHLCACSFRGAGKIVSDYQGGRDLKDFTQFADKVNAPPVSDVTEASLEGFKKKSDVSFLLVSSNKDAKARFRFGTSPDWLLTLIHTFREPLRTLPPLTAIRFNLVPHLMPPF
jgi:hypothetical protein